LGVNSFLADFLECAMNREKRVYLYVSDEERMRLEEAAERAGLSLSSWIRLVMLRAAKLEGGTGEKEPSNFTAKS